MFDYTEKKFAKDIIKAARQILPEFSAVYDASDSHINLAKPGSVDDNEIEIRLDNIYRQWKGLPRKERQLKLNEFLKSVLTPAELTDDQRMAKFRLRARTLEEVTNRSLTTFDQEHNPTLYLQRALVLELVEDSATTVSLVTSDTLSLLNIDKAQAFSMAAAAMVRETNASQWEATEDFWYSSYRDDYDFARLVAAGKDTPFPFTSGLAIAYAPSHSVCVISNQANADTLSRMIKAGDTLSENQRVLSNRLWTQDNTGQWLAYKNENDSKIASIVKLQEVIENTNNYNEQKNFLEQTHEYENDDVFIASYVGMRNNAGEIVAMCTYTLNLPSLLPETDLVNVYDHELEDIVCTIDWQKFQQTVDTKMIKRDDCIPPRYSLIEPLSKKQIDSLKQQ